MEPIQKGKQTNKASNMCTSDKGKQTNKQAEVAHAEVQMQGAVRSCITCGVQYTMCQSTQKSFGDALEMHWKSMEFDMQGHTLTFPQSGNQLRCHKNLKSIFHSHSELSALDALSLSVSDLSSILTPTPLLINP